MQRIRIQYAKRGRLRFTSHRDFARAFERALRRAQVPMAYSAGFTPHPKISYVNAAPTGVASEAEYLEIGLVRSADIDEIRVQLDAALPPGLDVVAAVAADGAGLAERINASAWRIELPSTAIDAAQAALTTFLAADEVLVERLTKNGRRSLDTRAPVVLAVVSGASEAVAEGSCAILTLVVQHATPVVRPDDVLSGLRLVADLNTPVPPRATRIAQGVLSPAENPPAPAAVLPVTAVTQLIDEWIADPLAAQLDQR